VLWKFLFIGLLWGTAVSVGNYYYLKLVVKKNENRPPRDKILSVVNCYITRYFINIAALLSIYWIFRDVWTIAGTGIGLTVMKNVTAVLELKKGRDERRKAAAKRKSYRRILEDTDDYGHKLF